MTDERFGTHDFGLSPDDEARAARLHDESIVVDMLFQGPCGYRSYSEEMDKQLEEEWREHRNAAKSYASAVMLPIRRALDGASSEFTDCWLASGITAGNRQVGYESDGGLAGFSIATAQFDTFPWLTKALRADDFRRAKAEGKRAGFLSSQNTDGIDPGLELLERFHDMGMRMIALTYNNLNSVGAGCTERTDAGVSNFGARVIERMNELGIIVDSAHSGRQTTLDACVLSSKPVVATHTSAGGLYEVDRAKSDEEIRAIAATGGVVGVYAVPFFLAGAEHVTIDAMLDHVDYIAGLVGWQHVGIGTDWPLQSPKSVLRRTLMPMVLEMGFRPEHNIEPEANLVGFDDYRDFPNITRGLVKRGYTDEQIAGIIGGNFVRVFEDVCG